MSENKENKNIIKKIIIVIAILSTYIMAFLLGKITNVATLGIKDKTDNNEEVVEPSKKPPHNVWGDITGAYQTPDANSTDDQNDENDNSEDNNEQNNPENPSDPSDPNNPNTPDNPNNPDNPEEPDDSDKIIILWQGNRKWSQLEELNIFDSKFYQTNYENKIAPGFFGTYEFTVENRGDKDVTYVMSFKEENPDNVNMVYKLMQENEYVLGNSKKNVYIGDVKLEEVTIPAKSKILYKLNWKWEDTKFDTQIGEKNSANYKLSIKIQATIEE